MAAAAAQQDSLLAFNISSSSAGGVLFTTLPPPPSSTGSPASSSVSGYHTPTGAEIWHDWGLQICLYTLILCLSVLGNVLVIVTLIQNTKMRTVTNVYLLNLSVSDLLLGVCCMPFTLVGTILQQFVFGAFMCKIVPYLQAVSVSVSAWTLVAMSVERYYAICHPLRSRVWQTRSHALRLIAALWTAALAAAAPTLLLTQLLPMSHGRFKCREQWPSVELERGYMVFIDLAYLVLPLIAMVVTFVSITRTLHRVMCDERAGQQVIANNSSRPPRGGAATADDAAGVTRVTSYSGDSGALCAAAAPVVTGARANGSVPLRLRHSNAAKSLASKRRVIKMLFVVVLEFFVCWTPLYILITASLFDPLGVYRLLGSGGISLCQLLSYTSCCCNPITYCFMNSGFRQSFLAVFGCRRPPARHADPLRSTSVAMRTLSCHATGGRDTSARRSPAAHI